MEVRIVFLEVFIERLKEFRACIINYVNEQQSPDRVYQLNIQLFPLTRQKEKTS